ncbi:acyl-CoA N-acyltransferase [Stereum hirsutum FP-91666 SS1]|uniref:acyl-CoA N-acyltransferase n=1 Tax=Stereum hirsutum (strain FP-91666) TaxID=721885 RepID=UPI000440C4C4|nr:acyl-CoA N-acyltransferase [Stereum hirsutum FP-91666 SS1]EIM92977.1 acyl-CoA N-acyltransferase [Stereum hirsutum FP-91666 SS1]
MSARSRMPLRKLSATQKAVKATAGQLRSLIPTTCMASQEQYDVQVSHSTDLSVSERELIWNIFEMNMKALSEGSSLGWNPPKKRRELFHKNSRFILVQKPMEKDSPASSGEIVAYTMFRFIREQGENLVYCYELQVGKDARRTGIGRLLMQYLGEVGRHWKMDKIMLTVFRSNEPALAAYGSMGFAVDPTSPGYGDEADWDEEDRTTDYWIMSREIS